jgi:hypothetical protein
VVCIVHLFRISGFTCIPMDGNKLDVLTTTLKFWVMAFDFYLGSQVTIKLDKDIATIGQLIADETGTTTRSLDRILKEFS